MTTPYRSPSGPWCRPVAQSEIGDMVNSLTYNTALEAFLLVGFYGLHDRPTGRLVWGVYMSTSRDLIHWTPRRLVFEAETTWTYECGDRDPIAYPSLIDPDSPSRSFDISGRTAYLYYTRIHYKDCKPTLDRDLVRVPVEISAN